ncbi:hypothetical protein GKE82_05640 [Conexibacter sp. W3-3-2]|uniref:hypothetical protein n=1 Tax=Conexibacter sp. W3-3-2 TaxID=2675227 RepID=UPI0012B847B3|nr:hypothetical protein [Conexibacter sp. W3-3-2]MTD43802.1 hypothetical protein [Conexibacter sp. W3-3-2]
MALVSFSTSLPCRLGRAWLAEEYLAGRTPPAELEFTLDTATLDGELSNRAAALIAQVYRGGHDNRVLVHGTGIDASAYCDDPHAEDPDVDYMDWPIREQIGDCPEIPRPTTNPTTVIDAYENWVAQYRRLAPKALSRWIDKYASSIDDPDHLERHFGFTPDQLQTRVQYRIEGSGEIHHTLVEGTKDLAAFQHARSALLLHRVTMGGIDASSVQAANLIHGKCPTLPAQTFNVSDLVAAYEAWAQDWVRIARHHHAGLTAQRRSFEVEMLRWAQQHGSEQLRIGLEDGFRMTKLYLEERIEHTAPGFYAAFQAKDAEPVWKPRSAPSETALRMRRAVQARFESADDTADLKVTIGWLDAENLPKDMIRLVPDWGPDDDEWKFEAIIVPDWLGRYTLIGPVGSSEHNVPGHVAYVLEESTYGLGPSEGFGAQSAGGFAAPVDATDFTPAPPNGDDDIPF